MLFVAIGIGVLVAGIVAFASTMLGANSESTATEDRLTSLATRKRGTQEDTKGGSLLLAGGVEDASSFINLILSRVPELGDYLDQADVNITPAKFASICLGCFVTGVVICVIAPVPILLGPFVGLCWPDCRWDTSHSNERRDSQNSDGKCQRHSSY